MSTLSSTQRPSYELLRKHKDSGWAYDALIKKVVKAKVPCQPSWLPLLETQYPHIALKLMDLWGTKACQDYLASLICDDRGTRQGFEPQVLQEILMLSSIHEEFPDTTDKWGDVWLTHKSEMKPQPLAKKPKFKIYQVNGRQLRLDSPVTQAQLVELLEAGMLPHAKLKPGSAYVGVNLKTGAEQVLLWDATLETFSLGATEYGLFELEALQHIADKPKDEGFIPLMELADS
jgi:hypothetical protein